MAFASLPLWERGLKFMDAVSLVATLIVAPSMGAWIEIGTNDFAITTPPWSLPLWERGLKWIKEIYAD